MIADLAAAPGIAAMRRRIRRETRDPQNLHDVVHYFITYYFIVEAQNDDIYSS